VRNQLLRKKPSENQAHIKSNLRAMIFLSFFYP
jgi:hypothetical protein